MKNKKSIAMAMAAVSTFGAVAPAFANGVQTLAFDEKNIDVMLASGYALNTEEVVVEEDDADDVEKKEVVKVYKRTDIYNTNGTKDRSDDTLKAAFKDAKIVLSQEDKEDSYSDKFVLATKVENIADVNEAKSYVETAKTLIAEAKEKGAKVVVKNEAAKIVNGEFKNSKVTVEITNKGSQNVDETYIFVGAEGIVDDEKTEAEVTAADLLKIFKELDLTAEILSGDKGYTLALDLDKDSKSVDDNYADINLVKYTIEKNIEKFDIVKEESGEQNADLDVTLYVKGSKQIDDNKVITITFKNVAEVNKDLIINMPELENTDFKGHWAQTEILNAMYAGQVDAVENFRPQASMTRAEFAKIACTVFNIPVNKTNNEPFHDVANGAWYRDYVAALYNYKAEEIGESVIQGDGENFRPEDTITRQEVSVILAKLVSGKVQDKKEKTQVGVDEKGPVYKELHTTVFTNFLDTKDIADWADNSVKYLNENAKYGDKDEPVVKGDENKKFNPTQNITRAEALVMVQRAAIAEEK